MGYVPAVMCSKIYVHMYLYSSIVLNSNEPPQTSTLSIFHSPPTGCALQYCYFHLVLNHCYPTPLPHRHQLPVDEPRQPFARTLLQLPGRRWVFLSMQNCQWRETQILIKQLVSVLHIRMCAFYWTVGVNTCMHTILKIKNGLYSYFMYMYCMNITAKRG